VMAAVVVIGLLAGATAWSLASSARSATAEELVSRLEHADRVARLASRRLGRPVTMVIDLDEQTIHRRMTLADGSIETSPTTRLPAAFRLDRVVLPAAPDRIAPRRIDDEAVSIDYRGGRSASYAMRLTADDSAAPHRWLIFAGLTGQMTVTEHEQEIDNLFALLSGGRADTD